MLDCKRLKKCREASFMPQEYVANHLHINLRTYKYYEAGQRQPSIEMLVALANFFCVSIDYLTGRSDDPEYAKYIRYMYSKEIENAPQEVKDFYNTNILGNELPKYRTVIELANDMWKGKEKTKKDR